MATHHGKNGVVKVGSNTLAEVQEFTVTEQVGTVDDTAMGDTAETHLIGIASWTGSLKCSYDPSDTNGQQALTKGASVTLNLYPEGTGSGLTYVYGTATITEVVRTVNRGNVSEKTFNFKGNGALTETTV